MNIALKRTLLSTLVLPFALGAASASAVEITDWGYSTTNVFSDSTFSDGGGTQDINDQSLSWGGTDADDRSSVAITDVSETSGLITNGEFVEGGTFTHDNNVISDTYAALTGFDLSTSLMLTAASPDTGDVANLPTLTFATSFRETPNSSPCEGTSNGIPCDDIFTIDNLEGAEVNENGWFQIAAPAFTIDDYTYTVFLELENLAELGETTCGVAGAPADCVGLLTEEETTNSFRTRFKIASSPVSVPEPGTLALLGLGLAGLGLSRRKKAATA
ncbi:THxN family PEP-CTERM protein [Marinobacter orientalis]|uniref:PEP-CTERM sorting domain-containing protein n=1 Tax=Marinobacter orientalis TaxID=1928859 RepID=A0A7Y0RCP3_9GAMM|nr:THxN family PEP-CTERM protein [Marinobacter orientalis]NMT63814.1 PEP-CTERM sorting domain-containing protein [Marinobacter orientalis]TGX49919.1 PEP-CTERM sorting domain-containing protein [Marinobacter orientalis]